MRKTLLATVASLGGRASSTVQHLCTLIMVAESPCMCRSTNTFFLPAMISIDPSSIQLSKYLNYYSISQISISSLCGISSQAAIHTTQAKSCLHPHYFNMCLATVATCGHCQQEICCALNICAEAQRWGMIHIAKPIPETRPSIDITNTQTDVYLLRVHSVMEQERIQVSRCSLCIGKSALKPGPLRAETVQQQRATHELTSTLNELFGFDVQRKSFCT